MGFTRASFLGTSLIFLAFLDSSVGLPTCNKCCIRKNHEEIDEPQRSTQNVWKPGQPALCDRTLTWGWYRFVRGEMPTKKVPQNHCGTVAPIWLRGNHPTVDYETVARSACVNFFDTNDGCAYSFDIYIRRCELFYVYYLGPTYACSIAYCAGDQPPCPNGKEGRPPHCSDPLDVRFSNDNLKDPVISFRDGLDEQNDTSVTLLCKVSILRHVENWKNVTYRIKWFSEGKLLKNEPFCQNPPKSTENTMPCPNRKELVSHLAGDEYKIGQRITCIVTAKFTTANKWSLPRQVQHPFFAGIKVHPTSFTVDQCAVRKEITITPTIPVRKNAEGKGLPIYFWLPPEMMLEKKACKIELSGTTPVKIVVVAICTTIFKTGRHKAIIPKILNTHSSSWNPKTGLPTIWVYLKGNHSDIHKCRAWADPHYLPFDNDRHFDFMGHGDFILYHNKERSFEVQTRQWVCNRKDVTCNCGAALRYQNDVIEFNCCNPKLYYDSTTPMKVKIRSKKCLGRGISITQVINGFNSKYEVLFPAGMKVELQRSHWGIGVTIFTPRAKNATNEKGLCLYNGTYDKDKVDAFGYTLRLNDSKQSLFESLPQQVNVGDMPLGKACSCEKENNKKPDCKEGIPVLFSNAMKQKMSNIAMCDRKGRDIQGSDDLTDEDFEQFVRQTYIDENKVQQRSKRALPLPQVSKKNATRYCNEKIAETDIGKLCAKLGTNVQALVNSCSADIEYTGDFSFAIGAVALLMNECGDVAARNGTFTSNESSEVKPPDSSIVKQMSQLLCPNDCTFNGKCKNGSCVCNKDFTAQDCSISVYRSPDISKLQGNGLCDRRKRPCKKVTVMGNGFLDSENITCHIKEFKVVNGSWTPNNTELKFPGRLTDLVMVDCYLPVSPVMQIPYDGNQEGTPAAGLMISVSNNGVHKSNDKLTFISYDSACMKCNVSTGCFLKNNSCFINGYCFVPNEANPMDWCYQCLPDVDTNSWTKRQVNLPPRITSNTRYFALYQEQLELMIETSDPEGMPVTISLMDGSPNGSVIQDNVISWKVATNKTTNFYLKTTDACNAFSTLVIDISIVVCQCRNDGKCLPHPQKPRGSGFYECDCAPGYTGDMCETDIDDCLSYPCSRGRCVDMLNSYKCICDPGYVGRNCDNDYDDCKSSLCAHGNCTDHVGGYTCSCEAGYTGDLCKIAPCSDPGVPHQGDRIVGGLRHDQTVTFTCRGDYVMKGARTITCSNGQWSNGKPSCLAPCGDPGSPKNGWKSGRDYIHAKSVRFGCYRGYRLIGAETITCQDGRWSNKVPVCKGVCRKPSIPYNGFLRGNSYVDGDEVTFSCKHGYDLFGSRKLRCLGRSWDSPEPECKASCRNPGDIAHGRKIGDDYRHGKTVVFVCDGKYSLEGNSRLKCDNGNWNADSPKCKVDGGYSSWSRWSQCSATCGGGIRQRSRSCNNPAPENRGRNCNVLGPSYNFERCNRQACPVVDGGYSSWSRWSQCSATCGEGTQHRSRSCNNPAPANNGRDCTGNARQFQCCRRGICPNGIEGAKRDVEVTQFYHCGITLPEACDPTEWKIRCEFRTSTSVHYFSCEVPRTKKVHVCRVPKHYVGSLVCCDVSCPC